MILGVTEDAYGILAQVKRQEYRSDEVAFAVLMCERLTLLGRECKMIVQENGPVWVFVGMGDASDENFAQGRKEIEEVQAW